MPTATLEKCTVCPETSKKYSLESIGHFPSWAYKLGKLKISKTGTPRFRAALLRRIPTSLHLKYPRKEKSG